MSGYPSGLTANQIELAIRMYWSPSVNMSQEDFVALGEAGLVEATAAISEKGLTFVRHILETPLPSPSWEVRRGP